MELALDGYRFDRQLRSSAMTEAWLAVRERDGLAVIAKVFSIEDRPGLEARVEHEFGLIRRLEVPGVVRALGCVRSGRRMYLLLEAHTGVDLAVFAGGQPLDLRRFFAIACELTATLAEVHTQRVIHRDIKPTNVLVDADGSNVMLADFGISVLLESEREHIHDPSVMSGTLPYLSPEQTGRTGRAVDFRSDLYSLGVTFYELLTGRRPFVADSSLELIHAHLARRPEPPAQLRPELPGALSSLVMKLLEKAPERRYQSARGLLGDLERMRDAFGRGELSRSFELGRVDVPLSLQLPHQLYGRERERALLRACFRRALEGPPAFCLVVGEAGVGKTALLDDLVGQVVGHGGRMARGAFEPGRDEPLSGLQQALTGLAESLLTEPAEVLAHWQQRLREKLGPLVDFVCELVPRFAAVLERAPSRTVPLGSDGARNRVREACVRVLEAMAEPSQPLVLGLDDLQWADAATIEVLDSLSGSTRTGLCVVLAARADALELGAPLTGLLAKLEHRGHVRAQTVLELGALGHAELVELLTDTLSLGLEQVGPLAEIVARKTGGNPFFVRQFLIYLSERDLLRCERGGWTFELDALVGAGLPETALEMMVRKLQRVDARVRELLLAAAVIGGDIDPQLLGRVLGVDGVAERLLHLVDEGLLIPATDGAFAFAHGRIREAADAMVDDTRRRAWHLAVGEYMLAQLDEVALEQPPFDLVEHLDRGYGLWGEGREAAATIDDDDAALRLVELNLRAGRRALTTGVPGSAKSYLRIAGWLLERRGPFPTRGEPLHELSFAVELELASAEVLAHEAARADARLERLLARDLSPIERGEVTVVRCRAAISEARLATAVEVVLAILPELGVTLPASPGTVDVVRLLPRLLWMVRPAGLERLRELPPMQERRIEVVIDLLTVLSPASFVASRELYLLLVSTSAELILEHGRHTMTPVVFGQVGLVLANALGRRQQALALGQVCAELAAGSPIAYRVEQLGLFLRGWAVPLLDLLEPLERLAEAALAVGDITSAALAKSNYVSYAWFGGLHLRLVEARVRARLRWVEQWGVGSDAPGGPEVIDACRLLIEGPPPEPGDLDPLELFRDPGGTFPSRELDLRALSALVLAVFGRWAEVHALLDGHIDGFDRVLPGSWYIAPTRLLSAIACAELARTSTGKQRRTLRRKLAHNATSFAEQAAQGGNVGHLADLLEGEISVLDGDLERAARRYERAREVAMAQQNSIIAALASERLGRALVAAGHRRLAIGPLLDARERYLTWGGFAKVAELERELRPELGPLLGQASTDESASERPTHSSSTSSSGSTSSTASKALDTESLLKAAQTLAEDLRLSEVISRVMAIALENAGAERGVLLLAAKGELSMMAEATLDETRAFVDEAPALAEVGDRMPSSLLNYVQRTAEPVVIRSAAEDGRFAADPYFRSLEHQGAGLSILCLPMIKRGRPVGMFYFENQLGAAAFSEERLEPLQLLAGHAASAVENARLYQHLRDSEIRWRSLVDQLPDYVVLIRRDGGLEYVNALARPRYQSGFQFNAREFVAGADAERVKQAIARVFGRGEPERLEVQVELSGSPLRWYAVRVAPIAIDGDIERAIVVATDVDDRKRAEAERDQLEARLRQQQRLDSIGTLASGVAHEINNPVQGILNYAELIAGSEAADELIREFAGEIEHETQRVATIVRHLLAFSRQELGEAAEPTTVAEIIQGTLSLVRAVMRRDQIQLNLALPDDLPKVACRRQQIQQVFMNLVTNARDALNTRYAGYDEAKVIEIGAEALERDGAAWIRIAVSDRAGGVPADIVARIFDPFFTTKGRDHGTGLGLAVSHGIVSEHGGELVLDNHPGEGATFRIELPCSPPVVTPCPPQGSSE